MQGSFDIKTVKKLLICHCHRHLQRATCSTVQCRGQLNSVKSHCDRGTEILIAQCVFLVKMERTRLRESNFSTSHRHTTGVTRCHSALEVHCSELSLLQNKHASCPRHISAGQQSDTCLSSVEHRELIFKLFSNVCLRYFPRWRSSDLIPALKWAHPTSVLKDKYVHFIYSLCTVNQTTPGYFYRHLSAILYTLLKWLLAQSWPKPTITRPDNL